MAEENMDRINQLKISNEVLNTIASVAVNDTKFTDQTVKKGRNVTVRVEDGEVIADVEMAVKYGTKIPSLVAEMQAKVKSSIENMTGLKVRSVNVSIIGMNIEKA